ncbi:hypothetical protein FS749_003681 [Ceratobasidium sp. UAMH 11750]|nr:hypothetical protein FS749_003681 [Ceratobasidium sp. UAMH 11750]
MLPAGEVPRPAIDSHISSEENFSDCSLDSDDPTWIASLTPALRYRDWQDGFREQPYSLPGSRHSSDSLESDVGSRSHAVTNTPSSLYCNHWLAGQMTGSQGGRDSVASYVANRPQDDGYGSEEEVDNMIQAVEVTEVPDSSESTGDSIEESEVGSPDTTHHFDLQLSPQTPLTFPISHVREVCPGDWRYMYPGRDSVT